MEFKAKQDQTKQDRLKYLLKQTEIFTHFILQNNKKQGGTNMEADLTDQFKNQMIQSSKGKDNGGKSSVSKRHQKKLGKQVEEDAEEGSD